MAAAKPVVARPLAASDLDAALSYYLDEAGEALGLRFVAAVRAASDRIGRQPGIGSPRYAHALHMPGLRSWRLTGFPHLLFYFERLGFIDLIRVLHSSSDIAAWLTEPEDP